MGKVIWYRITPDQMTFLKGRKKLWRENPELMRQYQSRATKAASDNKRRRRDKLVSDCLEIMPLQPMTTRQLWSVLAKVVLATSKGEKRPTPKKLKAMRMTLSRYGILSFDPADGLWKVKVA